jgi:hypothetical protein
VLSMYSPFVDGEVCKLIEENKGTALHSTSRPRVIDVAKSRYVHRECGFYAQ